uniref:RING-type domain-containing protein n=1 Tax=Panagrolaimus sp. JU765 TaxID=591449 RepID=A0AC34QWE5_9BILA
MGLNYGCSICMNRLFDSPIGALPCGHVFHFQCVHEWLSATEIGTKKACPTCRKRVKIYDIIQLFGFSDSEHEDFKLTADATDTKQFDELSILRTENEALKKDIRVLQTDTKQFDELAILRTENEALKKDIRILQDESLVERLQAQNEELEANVDRLTAELRTKNQELINCRLTVAEFSSLVPKLEEQHKRSTDEIKDAIEKYKELREAILKRKNDPRPTS